MRTWNSWGWIFAAIAIGAILGELFIRPGNFPSLTLKKSPCASCTLITEPEDGLAPILRMIRSASSSIDLSIYELDDSVLESALMDAAARGVHVRVILSQGYRGAPSRINQPAFNLLSRNHIPVHWAPSYFSFSHEKSIVIDHLRAVIMSFNLVSKYYPTGRDFGIIDQDPNDLQAMESAFDHDWNADGITRESSGSGLVWSPGSRAALITFITSASTSLEIYNEEMADPRIIRALEAAAERGITVRIVMTNAPEWKPALTALSFHGTFIRTFSSSPSAPRYIHAKMIIADNARAFIGSENFSATSLEENRELGIVTFNPSLIAGLRATFLSDWSQAKAW